MAKDELFSGESKNIEYKVVVPDKSEKYMKTVVAFANTQGGRLVIGIDDKTHQVVGVDNDSLFQAMDALTNAISDSCEPQIIPDIGPQTVDGKTVIVITVEAGYDGFQSDSAEYGQHELACSGSIVCGIIRNRYGICCGCV